MFGLDIFHCILTEAKYAYQTQLKNYNLVYE